MYLPISVRQYQTMQGESCSVFILNTSYVTWWRMRQIWKVLSGWRARYMQHSIAEFGRLMLMRLFSPVRLSSTIGRKEHEEAFISYLKSRCLVLQHIDAEICT